MILSFPHAPRNSGASERGVSPLNGAPLASLFVASSRDEARTVVRVSYYSQALATVRYRQGHAGILNWFRPVAGCFFRALAQACKQSSRVFTVSLSPGPFVALFHAPNKAWRRTHDVHENSATGA